MRRASLIYRSSEKQSSLSRQSEGAHEEGVDAGARLRRPDALGQDGRRVSLLAGLLERPEAAP